MCRTADSPSSPGSPHGQIQIQGHVLPTSSHPNTIVVRVP
uniref:Uncharacterized protein n=1 Tax=Arundo donax TaxID=35708 RepID=A0A0A9DJF1_ARUDO